MRFLICLACLLCGSNSVQTKAQGSDWLDIKEATVLPAKAPHQRQTLAQKEQDLLDHFSKLYALQGKPGIAILWNRRFADVFSQWQADSRQSSEVSMSGRPLDTTEGAKDETKGEKSESDKNIDCSWYLSSNSSGDCNLIRRSYTEKRIQNDPEINHIKHTSQLAEFKFNAGYAQAFLSAGATVIDRATIMRLVERQQQKARGNATAPDYYRIEADALIGHADYLAEVLLAGADHEKEGRDTYNVSIKDVKTGQILAMLHTDGLSFTVDTPQTGWVGSSQGYTENDDIDSVEDDQSDVINLGRSVALETMQALSQLWGR
jgi:hypothetical protein